MLHEIDFTRQRALMREFEKHVLDTQSHEIFLLWWYRTVPYRSYVKGWKISPSHYLNQDLATDGSTNSAATQIAVSSPGASRVRPSRQPLHAASSG